MKLITLAVLGIFGCSSLVYFFTRKDQCKFIPVTFDPFCAPLVNVEIEGKPYSVKIDLGSMVQLSLYKENLEQISKIAYGKTLSIDFRENEYESQNYLISKAKLGDTTFIEVMAGEANKEFSVNTLIFSRDETDPIDRNGYIGWALLKRNNLLLDFPHSRFAIVEDGKQIDYSLEDMLKVPFELTGSGVTITVNTDAGEKRLAVDTGATCTAIRASGCTSELREKDHRGLEYFPTYHFVIGEKDFGGMPLYPLDITSKMKEIDGFLGMNFLKCHIIYIDFQKNLLYISEKMGED